MSLATLSTMQTCTSTIVTAGAADIGICRSGFLRIPAHREYCGGRVVADGQARRQHQGEQLQGGHTKVLSARKVYLPQCWAHNAEKPFLQQAANPIMNATTRRHAVL